MTGILLMTAGIEAMMAGTELFTVLDRMAAARQRMAVDNRTDPTDAELDMVSGRIVAREDRIQGA